MKSRATRAVQRAVQIAIMVAVDRDEEGEAHHEQAKHSHQHRPVGHAVAPAVFSRADHPHTPEATYELAKLYTERDLFPITQDLRRPWESL